MYKICIHVWIHTRIYIYRHMNIYIHLDIHIYIHKYTCIHIYIQVGGNNTSHSRPRPRFNQLFQKRHAAGRHHGISDSVGDYVSIFPVWICGQHRYLASPPRVPGHPRCQALQSAHHSTLGEGHPAVCCSVSQCVAVSCSVLQCISMYYQRSRFHTSSSFAMGNRPFCSLLQSVAICCSLLQCVAVCLNVLLDF